MEYEDYEKAINLLKRSKQYLQHAHNEAESKHDNYGEYYMDDRQYEIMEETEKLLSEIEKLEHAFSDKTRTHDV